MPRDRTQRLVTPVTRAAIRQRRAAGYTEAAVTNRTFSRVLQIHESVGSRLRTGCPGSWSPWDAAYAELFALSLDGKTNGRAMLVQGDILLRQGLMHRTEDNLRATLDALICEEYDLETEMRRMILNPNTDRLALADVAEKKASRLEDIAAHLRELSYREGRGAA